MEYLKITPDMQLSREKIEALKESGRKFNFCYKQDYADIGFLVSTNLNGNFKECYGTVTIQPEVGAPFLTDIVNIEFFGE